MVRPNGRTSILRKELFPFSSERLTLGYSSWSSDAYVARSSLRAVTNTPVFAYSATMRSSSRAARRAHDSLAPNGWALRESRDSDAHPLSHAVAIGLDVTGSMDSVVRALHAQLPRVMGALILDGYLPHPHILIGGIGDATCDAVPMQISQFETDIKIEEAVSNLFLEGGGGGQVSESYELWLWAMANKTAMDCLDKRGQKGYLFTIGDEKAYERIDPVQVRDIFGDVIQMTSLPEVIAAARKKFEVFHIIPTGAHHGRDRGVQEFWRHLLGQNLLLLEDPAQVPELIAAQIGACQGLPLDVIRETLKTTEAVTSAISVPDANSRAMSRAGSVTGKLVPRKSDAVIRRV